MKINTILLTIITALLFVILYNSYTNIQQIQALKQEIANLWLKIDSVHQTCSNQPQDKVAVSESTSQSAGSSFLDFLIKLGEDGINTVRNEIAKQKVIVTSKYFLEDRYVQYKVMEPELLGEQVGEVVLNILVNKMGDVKSAKLKSATGITNEDVIEACKKAALKTDFNYDSEISHKSKQAGTITYIFSAK